MITKRYKRITVTVENPDDLRTAIVGNDAYRYVGSIQWETAQVLVFERELGELERFSAVATEVGRAG